MAHDTHAERAAADKRIPAFPESVSADSMGGFNFILNTGMTLRDYFAAKALVAICASNVLDAAANACCDIQKRPQPDVFAELSYAFADAMLAERAK